MDRETLQSVAEDLVHLRSWHDATPTADVRRGSAILRRLIVEDIYGAAWRAIGAQKQPKLVAVDLMIAIGNAPLSKVGAAFAGGALYRGAKIGPIVMTVGNTDPGFGGPSIREAGFTSEREFTLSEFVRSHSGYINGVFFTRGDVVKYIANVRGGVHVGGSRRASERQLVKQLTPVESGCISPWEQSESTRCS